MRVWKLNKDGSITIAGMHESYAQGQYRNIMPAWITDAPTKQDFDDWASRVPRPSDNFKVRKDFDYGLYYRSIAGIGDGWIWGSEHSEHSIAPQADSLIKYLREANRERGVQHDECVGCGEDVGDQ
jgi:hypothetical protein